MAQWYSACLAFVRPWVPRPGTEIQNKTKKHVITKANTGKQLLSHL
jgi:hypothetical protein